MSYKHFYNLDAEDNIIGVGSTGQKKLPSSNFAVYLDPTNKVEPDKFLDILHSPNGKSSAPKYHWDGGAKVARTLHADGVGYTDLSDIIRWGRYWRWDPHDYKFARAKLKSFYVSANWGTYNTEKKTILCDFFLVTAVKQDEIYPDIAHQVVNGQIFHDSSIASRESRYVRAAVHMFNHANADFKEIFKTINTGGLATYYIRDGIEGTLEDGGLEGLFDFIEARSGTTWASSGLAAQTSYTIRGLTLSQLVGKIMDILKDGEL